MPCRRTWADIESELAIVSGQHHRRNLEVAMKTVRNMMVIAAALWSGAAQAQYTDGVVKIGVLNDMSSLYSDVTGAGSVAAARLAVEDFGAAAKGIKVEIVSG